MRTRNLPKGLWLFGPLVIGILAPRKRILGMDIAGVVEAVGESVTKFKRGDEVIALPAGGFGGHAEYRCFPESGAIALKPKSMSFEDAVTLLFGGQTALRYLRRAKIKPGDEVLVNGASGAVGTAAVQIAKHMGAVVTGVTSGGNADLVRSLGADHVIDYEHAAITDGEPHYHVVIDIGGNRPLSVLRRVLTSDGTLVIVGGEGGGRWTGGIHRQLHATVLSPLVRQRLGTFIAKANRADLDALRALIESGAVTPVIDRVVALHEAPDAIRDLAGGHVRGKIVIAT
jgi:NADPH:quinone reductase-like Zn-dependent oxidoreductase